jgi:predicted dehydrogenase
MSGTPERIDEATIGLGLVGLGWFGAVLADRAKATGLSEVVSCFARSAKARATFAEAHGCRAAESLEAMLEDPAVHAVLIATPHSTHPELIERAAAAGKHIFAEKPLALTMAEARGAIAAAQKAGVVLQIGHNRRRQPANRRIKAMLDAGELGTVMQLEGSHTAPGALNPELVAWRRNPVECPAGGMTALGIHEVDTFNYLVGPAKRVTAFSKQLVGLTDLDEATMALIEFESGPLAYLGTTYFAPPVVTVAAFGTAANVWNEQDGARLFVQRDGEAARTEQDVETIDTVADELAEFGRCIRDGTEPETGGPEGLEVAAVLEAIIQSAESGLAVELSSVKGPRAAD